MRRGVLITLTLACATVLGSVIVFHAVSAQGKKPPPAETEIYNPYPPGILPADLVSEIERVRREVRGIFEEALAEWRHAEVDERLRQRRATKAACRSGGGDGDVVGQRLDRHGRCSLTDESSDVRRSGASGHRIVIGWFRPWR